MLGLQPGVSYGCKKKLLRCLSGGFRISRKRVICSLAAILLFYLICRYFRVFEVLGYGVSYLKVIAYLLKQDNQHYYDIMLQEAQTLWKLHVFQKKYMDQWCEDVPSRDNITWLITLASITAAIVKLRDCTFMMVKSFRENL